MQIQNSHLGLHGFHWTGSEHLSSVTSVICKVTSNVCSGVNIPPLSCTTQCFHYVQPWCVNGRCVCRLYLLFPTFVLAQIDYLLSHVFTTTANLFHLWIHSNDIHPKSHFIQHQTGKILNSKIITFEKLEQRSVLLLCFNSSRSRNQSVSTGLLSLFHVQHTPQIMSHVFLFFCRLSAGHRCHWLLPWK